MSTGAVGGMDSGPVIPAPRIVAAQLVHVPAITEIYNEAIMNGTATFDTEHKTRSDRELWLTKRSARCPVIVALAPDETVLGWGALSSYSDRLAYQHTVEDSIYLRPEARGQGVGTLLLDRLIQLAAAYGHHSIIAKITADNAVSIHLHEKFGFTTVGLLREVGSKFDRWLDVAFMQKLL